MTDLLQPVPAPSWRERAALAKAYLSPIRIVGVAVSVVVAAGGGFLLLRSPAPPVPLVLPAPGDSPSSAPGGPGSPAKADPAGPSTTPGGSALSGSSGSSAKVPLVTVHAAGRVRVPGVYTLPDGARVADVVTAAGGLAPDADLDRINLAARVADGERVYVLRRGEQAPPAAETGGGGAGGPGLGSGASTGVAAGPIDLNTASVEQLDTLPGVGPATAAAIVKHRERIGRFRSVGELVDVPGIGPAKLEALRPLVRV